MQTVEIVKELPKLNFGRVKVEKRTLTNLYNQRPDWLDAAHKKLDAAVLDAYGWPHDLSDEEILARLPALLEIVHELNVDEVAIQRSRRWYASAVKYVLPNAHYAGAAGYPVMSDRELFNQVASRLQALPMGRAR